MGVYFWDWFNEAFINRIYPQQIYKTGNVRNETLRHSNLIHSLTALYVIDSKDFARAQSIFTDLILADVSLSSVSRNTGPSDEAPLESATNPSFLCVEGC